MGKPTSVMFNPLGEEEFKVDYWEDFPFNDLYEIDYSGGERYDWWLNTLDEWSGSHKGDIMTWQNG